jgi:endonuclease/exonuclease/phosphatase family metal-dependent hydrolase
MIHPTFWRSVSSASARRRHARIATFFFVATLMLGAAVSKADDGQTIRVMTRHMYTGSFFTELLSAKTPQEFVAAVTTTYQNIVATKPAERIAAIAQEIAGLHPDLVGLQQASIIRTGSGRPATTVQFDFVQILLAELAQRGKHYHVVGVVPGFDGEAPTTLGFNVRITTRDVMIARTEFPAEDFKLSNLQIRTYIAAFSSQTPLGPFTDPSGFVAIDASLRGQKFRFVTTHLDVTPAISYFQALELVEVIGSTSLPIVLVCDCNSTPDISSNPSFPTYKLMQDAGFVDAFRTAHPDQPGFTFGQAENLLNPVSSLFVRIDLVQFRGPFTIQDVHVFGADNADRTPSGLWPGDHAGVVATLSLKHGHAER